MAAFGPPSDQPAAPSKNERFFVQPMGSTSDFENVDQIILPDVIREGSRFGLTIQRSDVVDALGGLVADGLAKVYLLSPMMGPDPFAGELASMPRLDVPEENFQTYFYITKKGMDFHRADDTWWPFDDKA